MPASFLGVKLAQFPKPKRSAHRSWVYSIHLILLSKTVCDCSEIFLDLQDWMLDAFHLRSHFVSQSSQSSTWRHHAHHRRHASKADKNSNMAHRDASDYTSADYTMSPTYAYLWHAVSQNQQGTSIVGIFSQHTSADVLMVGRKKDEAGRSGTRGKTGRKRWSESRGKPDTRTMKEQRT